MFTAQFHRARAAMALEMASAARSLNERRRYLALWSEWSASALRAEAFGRA
jgi:hypothetical protein